MDPIIRLAHVSSVARRIGRQTVPSMRETVAEAASTPDPLLPHATPAPEGASVSVPNLAPDSLPAIACGCADELARAEHEYEAALARRDAEIDALRKAAQQAAIEMNDAYTDAEQRGYAAGEKKALQAASEAMQAQIDHVKSLVGEIGRAARQLTETAEDVMVDIVFTAICRILGDRGATREAVKDVVRAVVAAMREREQLVVRLHPDDAALLNNAADGGEMRISADPTVVLGGCIIDGPSGSLDARFELQLESLGAALKSVRASRAAGQDTV